jgi:hypothetical protein
MQTEEKQKINSNTRFEYILSHKAKKDKQLKIEIEKYCFDYGIEIPKEKNEIKKLFTNLLENSNTDEIKKIGILLKLYYNLTLNFSIGAIYINPETKKLNTQTICHIYNKNKISNVWNWRKANILRKKFNNIIKENLEEIKNFIPAHLVLTLKRNEKGEYKGKKFFGSEIIQEYNNLRKTALFNISCYGGEWGLETKKGKAIGYHIHIHSFLLINKDWNYNKLEKLTNRQVLETIKLFGSYKTYTKHNSDNPKEQNKNLLKTILLKNKLDLFLLKKLFRKYWIEKTNSNQIHLERCFIYKRDKNGKIETYLTNDKNGKTIEVPKKIYINQNSENKDYINAILECIKYHFKGDLFYNTDNKKYDLDTIAEVLLNTKNKRLFGTFGKWYKINKDITDENILKLEIPIKEKIKNLINPFTNEIDINPILVAFLPHQRKHYPKDNIFYSMQSHENNLDKFIFINDDLTIKEIVQNLIRNNITKIRYLEKPEKIKEFLVNLKNSS